jgi:hypothetical protein
MGAKLEHCLANLNQILPLLWPKLRDGERWQVGTTYSQVYSDGLETETAGLKQALLKVKGFDYVPETLRSSTFTKAAEALIQAHEGMNNFYNEENPALQLEKLGTVIPAPALGPCMTALLCVRLGNSYGASWSAQPIANRLLKRLGAERWSYYLENVLPGEMRVLEKLESTRPNAEWRGMSRSVLASDMAFKNKNIRDLVTASMADDERGVMSAARKLIAIYYGKNSKIGIP